MLIMERDTRSTSCSALITNLLLTAPSSQPLPSACLPAALDPAAPVKITAHLIG